MKAHHQFRNEVNKLISFYKSTIYSYEHTEELIGNYRKNKKELIDLGLELKKPQLYKIKRKSKALNRKNLSEIVFVRGVSALEVFLVDLIRDIFIQTKEPFKKQDIIMQFTQAELLSIKTPASLFNKVINKECRKLTSGGFVDIIKYYKKHFDIDLSSFSPGKRKMEEYHDRRHLLVHRLGKTDQQFRGKYKTSLHTISIEENYLFECFKDFSEFSELLSNQVNYRLNNELKKVETKEKEVEAKSKIEIELINGDFDYFEPNFEFWAGDEFSMFGSIIDNKEQIDINKFTLSISGTNRQMISYSRIIRKAVIQKEINAKFIKIKNGSSIQPSPPRFLDEELIEKIKSKLPNQPWVTGIHKKVAAELEVSNKLVSIAIQQLIGKGIFKQQIDGIMIDQKSE